jgi:hypothetical protein
MIHFTAVDEGLHVTQTISAPSVYLDHWALRSISESDSFAGRLSEALLRRGGTLVLSWLNVVEFSKVADENQRRKADSFVNLVAENVYWLEPVFFTVVRREESKKRHYADPPSDLEFLDLYVTWGRRRATGLKILGSPSIFAAVYANRDIPREYDEVADTIVAQLTHWRKEFETDSGLRSTLKKNWPQSQTFSRGTRFIARALIARFLKDKFLKLNRNNAVDLTHAVVSVSYCDYVLLDTQWAAMVNDARGQLGKMNVTMPIAKVFSKKGMEVFLDEIAMSKARAAL